MYTFDTLHYFIVASLLLIIAPGPDIIFLITQALNNGPRSGLPIAMGLACGNLIHTLAAAFGISIIFQTSSTAFSVLKVFGVFYLLFLAYEQILCRKEKNRLTTTPTQTSLFTRGVLMNVLNPKVALFFLAFLPQFIPAYAETIWKEIIFLGILFTTLVVLIFGSIGLFANKIQHSVVESFISTNLFKWISATIYLLLAGHLLIN